MTTQVAKWGNSLWLRLPESVAKEAQVGDGDKLDVVVEGGAIVVGLARARYSLGELVGGITNANRHDQTDWGTPVGRETWQPARTCQTRGASASLRGMIYDGHSVSILRSGHMQVCKWGNSLAVRLPAAVVDALELEEGDQIEIRVAGDREFEVTRDRGRQKAIERLRRLRRTLPAGFTFDREEEHAR